MGKYTYSQKELPKKAETHEIWSGFGCLIMLILPAVSMAASVLTVQTVLANKWKIIPRELLGFPRLPDIVYKSEGLRFVFLWMTEIKDLYAYLALGVVYMVLLSGLIAVVYAAVYRAVGPSRYGPLDAPPPTIKVTKKPR